MFLLKAKLDCKEFLLQKATAGDVPVIESYKLYKISTVNSNCAAGEE
jgi:hypothetical protein